MKNITDYISEHKISESKTDIEKLLYAVERWFYSHCGEDDYDSHSMRVGDLKAMKVKGNDPAIDLCIEYISDKFKDASDYRDEIENKLAELAKDELEWI